MEAKPVPPPCSHKWIEYRFMEQAAPDRICNVCGINERDLPPPKVEPIDPELWNGYGI